MSSGLDLRSRRAGSSTPVLARPVIRVSLPHAWPALGAALLAIVLALGALVPRPAAAAVVPDQFTSVHEPGTGGPTSLWEAYDLTALARTQDGSATVALVELGPDAHLAEDLTAYRTWAGLPACTTATGCLREVGASGGAPPVGESAPDSEETALDIDAVSALCPLCHILVVVAEGPVTDTTAQATAARLGATVISDSWVHQAPGGPYEPFDPPGVPTVGSSGDAGYLTWANDWEFPVPAALPNTTAAGGTDLRTAVQSGVPSLRGYTETAWSGAGSYCDPFIAKPPWQTDTGCAGRSAADLSAEAGTRLIVAWGGKFYEIGGTSLAAPLVAAFYALTGAPASNPSWVYQMAPALNDITEGGNGSCPASAPYMCAAGPGYDGPTGVGSISGSVVRGAPGIARASMVNGSYTQKSLYNLVTHNTSFNLEGGVWTNGLPTTYWWQYGRTVTEHETSHVALPASCSISRVAGALNELTASGEYEYRLVAQNSIGTRYGYTVSAKAALGEYAATEPTLPATTPVPCPVASPLPDAPTPTPPAAATPPIDATPKTPAMPRPVASPVTKPKSRTGTHNGAHGPSLVRIGKPTVVGGVVKVRASCPADATKGCQVREIAKWKGISARTTAKLKRGHAGPVRLRLPSKLRALPLIEVHILARELGDRFESKFFRTLSAR